MPLLMTQGAASTKSYGQSLRSSAAVYIEDVFSTYLYTGNGGTQTITNGIDLSGKGGLVWLKARSTPIDNALFDTARGTGKEIYSNKSDAQQTSSLTLTAFNATGFSLSSSALVNSPGDTYASWTFRKQAKFFDVVTYTGNGTTTRSINHNLGSTPGFVIVKRTDSTGNWIVSAYDGATYKIARLNTTAASFDTYSASFWTSTTFRVANYGTLTPTGSTNDDINTNGATYVAYLFAHNAGGFGATGTDNVISCGSYTGTGISPGPRVELGWEPQFILYKATTTTGDWGIHDFMRGLGVGTSSTSGSGNRIEPNTSDAETGASNFANIDATGFTITPTVSDINGNGQTYIYIAIRRGPMKTPTTGTSVFVPYAYNGSGAGEYTTGINQDLFYQKSKGSSSYVWSWYDRLRGPNLRLQSNATNPESSTSGVSAFNNESMTFAAADGFSSASPWGGPYIGYAFRRAPGFFDVVCYTGNGSVGRTVTHNLGVAPELSIIKVRNLVGENWNVWHKDLGDTGNPGYYYYLQLNATTARQSANDRISATSATTITMGDNYEVNRNTYNYVAYLFATVAGVSKVGSYTGTGTTKQIDCGFTGGARFVLIKRIDGTGDWYVWDTARGIVASDDPYLLLNSTAAEVTNTDYVDTYSAGFEISSTAPAAINANGGTYIFLAIA